MEKIANLNAEDLRTIVQDYLCLSDNEFLLAHNIRKTEIDEELDADESLASRFNSALDKAFTTKIRRDCYVTISKLVEEISAGGDVNKQRVAQQSLQTMMTLKKDVGGVKDKDKKDYMSVLEELE